MSEDQTSECPAEKGKKEIWRKVPGDFYSPSIEAFPHDGPLGGCIRVNVGGSVITQPIELWHRQACHGYDEIDHAWRIRQVEELTARLAQAQKVVEQKDDALRMAKETLLWVTHHAPGYDWNADPSCLTLRIGKAFEMMDAALSPERPEKCATCGKTKANHFGTAYQCSPSAHDLSSFKPAPDAEGLDKTP